MFAPITPRTKSPSTKHEVKQDWQKLYRATIIESDRSKLLQRVEDADAAILLAPLRARSSGISLVSQTQCSSCPNIWNTSRCGSRVRPAVSRCPGESWRAFG